MREPGTRLAAEGQADRLQGRDQPTGLARIGGDELGHTLLENATCAAGFRQTNLRTMSRIRTGSGPQGRSVRWRW